MLLREKEPNRETFTTWLTAFRSVFVRSEPDAENYSFVHDGPSLMIRLICEMKYRRNRVDFSKTLSFVSIRALRYRLFREK